MSEDSVLLNKIKEAMEKAEQLDTERVHLRVVGKVAFLDGEVPSKAQFEALEELVRKIEGVRWVQNRLQIDAADTPAERNPHYHEH